MKKVFTLVLIAILVITTLHLNAQKLDATTKAHITMHLPGWTKSFKNFNLSDFKKEDTKKFEDIETDPIDVMNVYRPILTFSKDGSQFIDIYSYKLNLEIRGNKYYSYGGEPDQAINLYNLRTKEWKRILFLGTTSEIQDIIWISNTKFILVGIEQDENSDNYHPQIYIGNTDLKTFGIYKNINKKCVQNKEGYTSPQLKKIDIIYDEDVYDEDAVAPAESKMEDEKNADTTIKIPTFKDPEVQQMVNEYASFINEFAFTIKSNDTDKINNKSAELAKKAQDWGTKFQDAMKKLDADEKEMKKFSDFMTALSQKIIKATQSNNKKSD